MAFISQGLNIGHARALAEVQQQRDEARRELEALRLERARSERQPAGGSSGRLVVRGAAAEVRSRVRLAMRAVTAEPGSACALTPSKMIIGAEDDLVPGMSIFAGHDRLRRVEGSLHNHCAPF